jgi:hypothetical protein
MRKLEYLSPSSLRTFEEDPERFYIYYLADAHPPRDPQTKPMSIGSAIDARIKAELEPTFDLRELFEDQVEPHNRDWAWPKSAELFEAYKASGALADLKREIQSSIIQPRYEFKVIGNVSVAGVVADSVPVMGKPDLYYVTEDNLRVILDFKVNGFCAARKTSPKKGYIKIRPGGGEHKDAYCEDYRGVIINVAHPFEDIDSTWADQFTTYGWQLGADEFVVGVEQFVCAGGEQVAGSRFASHRGKVGVEHQKTLARRYVRAWEIVNSDWIFREMTRSQSQEKQAELDEYAETLLNADFQKFLSYMQ